jgi:hypothetical protein
MKEKLVKIWKKRICGGSFPNYRLKFWSVFLTSLLLSFIFQSALFTVLNNLTSDFWGVYEVEFPEGSDMRPPRDSEFPLGVLLFFLCYPIADKETWHKKETGNRSTSRPMKCPCHQAIRRGGCLEE